jgi:hypothetical protein
MKNLFVSSAMSDKGNKVSCNLTKILKYKPLISIGISKAVTSYSITTRLSMTLKAFSALKA